MEYSSCYVLLPLLPKLRLSQPKESSGEKGHEVRVIRVEVSQISSVSRQAGNPQLHPDGADLDAWSRRKRKQRRSHEETFKGRA